MLDLQTKIKRQIEILGLCIDAGEPLRTVDLAVIFGCEELTIKRDLKELRSYGVDIHSAHSKGVCLEQPLEPHKMKALIAQYIGISNSENTFDKATALMIKKQQQKALSLVVKLQRSIEAHTRVVIDYVKEEGSEQVQTEIGPLQIFQSDGYWRVLALHDGRIKQYHLNKIAGVQTTDRKFDRTPQDAIDDLFRFSFGSWVGAEQHPVRMLLSKTWADRIRPTQLMEKQSLTENADGSVVFEMTVNSLDEVASWVVSRGAGVTVLAPETLREKVMSLAEAALANHRT